MKKNELKDYFINESNKNLKTEDKEKATFKANDCNDKIFAFVEKDKEIIKNAIWTGEGCSVFAASSSYISIKLNEIKDINKGIEFLNDLENAIKNDKYLGEFDIYKILKKHTSRKKCVYIVINAFREELEKI